MSLSGDPGFPFVERVSGRLKGGCDVTLGRKTLLVGPNGSGKSTILQTIELATRGSVSDAEGREIIRNVQGLSRLFPQGPYEVDVTLSDGTYFRWSTQPGAKDGSFREPIHIAPRTIAWPVQDMEGILAGDASTVASWLERLVLGAMTEDSLLRPLPVEVRDEVKALMKRQKKLDFMALAHDARTEAKNLRTNATKKEGVIDRMLQGVALPLLDEEREAMEQQLTQAPTGGMSLSELAHKRQELEKLVDHVLNLQTQIAQAPQPNPRVKEALDKASTALDLIQRHEQVLGDKDCWVCGSDRALKLQKASLTATIEAVRQKYGTPVSTAGLQTDLSLFDAAMRKLAAEIKAAVVYDPTARDEVVRKLAADETARQTWRNAEAGRAEARSARVRADHLTIAAKSLEAIGREMLERLKSKFEQEVNGFLPVGDRFAVDLDSARVGLVRNGQLHSALSGAEWTRVLLALATAQVPDSTPSLLAPRDRAWDADTLGRVMEALRDAPGQVILMSTVLPKAVEGWTVIELG
jgi:ABC-type branched-subunit amino acid transport system ATPase component